MRDGLGRPAASLKVSHGSVSRVPSSRLPSGGARARRHPQRGDRRARRPRQDDARRRDALAVRRVPREPGRRRAGHGLDGPRAREGHHDPRQEHGGPLRRREDQHRRHARPRRLRRRGRARPRDGRRRAAARRRERGPAAADPLRAAQGARGAPAGDPRRQQGRPPDARIAEVVDEVYELFLDLDADENQIDFPIVYCNAAGGASLDATVDGLATTSSRSSRRCSRRSPRRRTRRATRCRRSSRTSTRRRTSAGSRSAACATARSARASRSRGAAPTAPSSASKVTELYVTEALDRVDADEAGPGEIIAVAGHRRRHDRRDARRSPTTRGRCRRSRSTSRASR